MNITKEQIDDLNAIVKVAITKDDYQEKVDQILSDYRKQANIPGFRKGQVPMGLIKKQYGKAILVDEVNKLLQDNLNKYLTEEKLDVLGNPLPKQTEDFNWDAEELAFEFELGLAPDFEVDLKFKKALTHYKIVLEDKSINEQVNRIQKQYGKLISKNEVEEGVEINGVFKNEEHEIDNKSLVEFENVKSKAAIKNLTGKKVGDVVTLNTKDLFEENYQLSGSLGLPADKTTDLEIDVEFTIEEVNFREPAELNQELYDKLFPNNEVSSEEDLKNKIKEDSEKQFEQQSDQKLMNDVSEKLIEEIKFDLPADFLQKWIQVSGEEMLSDDQAKEEFEKSEKGIRYQLIESKIITENNLQVQVEELKEFAKGFMKSQMAQYGHLNPSEEELEGMAMRVLGNEEEVKRLSQQLLNQKIITLFKEKANLKVKEVTFENFIKEAYK